jgi:hypothetical protein
MRIRVWCEMCSEKGGFRHGRQSQFAFRTDSVYRYTCERGHKTVIVFQQQLFEVLSEAAIQELADGYYREAIGTFVSCLERFYEFYWRTMAVADNISEEEAEKTWKLVSCQSERQVGMFVSAYLAHEGSAPKLLSVSSTERRSNVIDRGLIPTEEEAVSFGQEIFGLVDPIIELINFKYAQALHTMRSRHVKEAMAAANCAEDESMSVPSSPTPLSFWHRSPRTMSDSSYISKLVEDRRAGWIFLGPLPWRPPDPRHSRLVAPLAVDPKG